MINASERTSTAEKNSKEASSPANGDDEADEKKKDAVAVVWEVRTKWQASTRGVMCCWRCCGWEEGGVVFFGARSWW